jgi:hypothetical protein
MELRTIFTDMEVAIEPEYDPVPNCPDRCRGSVPGSDSQDSDRYLEISNSLACAVSWSVLKA